MNKWFKRVLTLSLVTTAQFQSSFIDANEQAEAIEKPNFYVHMDIKALSASHLGDILFQQKSDGFALLNEVLGEDFVEQINYLSVQGNLQNDKSKLVLIEGDFSKNQDLITDKWQALGLTHKTQFNHNTIYSGQLKRIILKIKEAQDKLEQQNGEENIDFDIHIESSQENEHILYSTFKTSNVIIISDNLASIKLWLSDEKQWQPSKQSNAFEVVVDIKKSLLHGAVNLDEMSDEFQFESISAQQLTQVSATYNENNGDIELQLGLETTDDETANQIKSVVYGLIALKMLSNNDPLVNSLLSTVQLEQDAGNLLLNLSGSIESFQALLKQID